MPIKSMDGQLETMLFNQLLENAYQSAASGMFDDLSYDLLSGALGMNGVCDLLVLGTDSTVAEHRSTLDLTQECLGGMWGMLESLSIAPSQIEILDADDDGKMGLVNSVKVMAYRALTDKLSLLNDLCEIEDDNAGDGEEDLAHAARNTYCEAVQKITGYDPRDGNFHKENGPGE